VCLRVRRTVLLWRFPPCNDLLHIAHRFWALRGRMQERDDHRLPSHLQQNHRMESSIPCTPISERDLVKDVNLTPHMPVVQTPTPPKSTQAASALSGEPSLVCYPNRLSAIVPPGITRLWLHETDPRHIATHFCIGSSR
jgi:hypothetical protein